MQLDEAIDRLHPFISRRFDSFLEPHELVDLRTNKGNVGQILERLLGLTNNSRHLDFDDGELKTNKSDRYGNPIETMFITQIAGMIDELLAQSSFVDSSLLDKINNLLYVPVCKEGPENAWMFLPFVHIELTDRKHAALRQQLENDYLSICNQLITSIETSNDGFIHTSNGRFIQIRSKDSKPYHPIYSSIYHKKVSNKNHAFYFKKDFMHYLQSISPDYPLR